MKSTPSNPDSADDVYGDSGADMDGFVKFEDKGKKTPRKPYDKKKFVGHYIDAYKQDLTINELAQKISVDVPTLRYRISTLKSYGVKLPKLRKINRMTVAHELNAFIAELSAQDNNNLPKQSLKEDKDEN